MQPKDQRTKSKTVKGIALLTGSTALGQGILIAASPLLTRLYTPEDLGLLAVFASLVGIFGFISTLRYQMAIPLPDNESDAAQLVKLNLVILLLFTSAIAAITYPFHHEIARLLQNDEIATYFYLLLAGIFTTGFYQTFYYWLVRKNNLKLISKSKIVLPATTTLVQLTAFPIGAPALLFARVIGPAAASLVFIKSILILKNLQKSPYSLKSLLIRYKRFPLLLAPGEFMGQLGKQSPPILLATLFSSSAAGLYLLAERITMMPIKIIGKSVSDAFFGKLAQKKSKYQLAKPILKTYNALTSLAAPPALIALFHAPLAFSLIFGEQWFASGQIVQLLIPLIFTIFITSPMGTLFSVLERQDIGAKFQIATTFTRIISICVGAYLENLFFGLALMSLTTACVYIMLLVWIFRSMEISLALPLRATLYYLLVSSMIITPFSLSILFSFSIATIIATTLGCSVALFFYYQNIYNIIKE